MKISDCHDFTNSSFRFRVENFWANYKGSGQFLTLGAVLATIKTEKLWKKWGHKTFSAYCRNELHLVPIYHENILVIVYLRLKSLGVHEDEMARVEKRNDARRIALLSKFTTSRTQFLWATEKFHESPLEEIRSFFLHPRHGKRSTLPVIKIPRGVATALDHAHKSTATFFGVANWQSPFIHSILALILVHRRRITEKSIQRLSRQFGLNSDVAGKIILLTRREL